MTLWKENATLTHAGHTKMTDLISTSGLMPNVHVNSWIGNGMALN
jgi:hypothetical protein